MPRSVDTVLTVDAQGRISADFSGHVSAAGVDLTEALTAAAPADNKVRWLDAGGVSREEILGYNPTGALHILAALAQLDGSHLAVWQAQADASNASVQVQVQSGGSGNQFATLLTQHQDSDFVQVANRGTGERLAIYGPTTLDANGGAAMAAGTENTQTWTHNLALNGGTSTTVVIGHLEDGDWAGQFGWRAVPGINNVAITFNNHGPNAGWARLRFFITVINPY